MLESHNKIEEIQFEKNYLKIYKILLNAKKSKYYEQHLARIDFSKPITYDMFSEIPITTKADYQNSVFNMYAGKQCDFSYEKFTSYDLAHYRDKIEYGMKYGIDRFVTSGSTGQPLEVLRTVTDNKKDYILLNYYRKKLTDYDFKDPFIWVWPINPIMRQLNGILADEKMIVRKNGYKYSLHRHSSDEFAELYKQIVNTGCKWITSSPSVLANFAEYIKNNVLQPIRFKYIECHSENLHDWQKDIIFSTFGVDPVSIYSSNEVQFMGAKCPNNHLHIFSMSCFIEAIKTERKTELIVTSLNYYGFPIIRYKLGDCGEWSNQQHCDCSLSGMPILNLSGFRSNDFVKLRNGAFLEPYVISDSIYLLNNSLRIEIKKYKVIQIDFSKFEIYMPYDIIEKYRNEILVFMIHYLSQFINESIFIDLKNIDDHLSKVYEGKYKYFETKI